MEISKELASIINDQINYELYSGYIYLSMAAWFERNNLNGMTHWMKMQAKEEFGHAMRFWKHMADRGGKIVLESIEKPKTEWESPLKAWEVAFQHEMNVTKRIFKIGEIADKEGDKTVTPLLKWFYNEQAEEEEQTRKVLEMLKKIGNLTNALSKLDTKLGNR